MSGNNMVFNIKLNDRIKDLKTKIYKKTNIPEIYQKIYLLSTLLDDDDILSNNKLIPYLTLALHIRTHIEEKNCE